MFRQTIHGVQWDRPGEEEYEDAKGGMMTPDCSRIMSDAAHRSEVAGNHSYRYADTIPMAVQFSIEEAVACLDTGDIMPWDALTGMIVFDFQLARNVKIFAAESSSAPCGVRHSPNFWAVS